MCNTANATIIGDIISEKIAEAQSGGNPQFTAYDITKEAKRRNATENHYQMRNEIHARFSELQNAGFTRSLVQTPTGDTFLYYLNGADIQPSIDRINGTAPSTAAVASVSSIAAPASIASVPTPTGSVGTVHKQKVDAEGRLPIYGDMTATMNVKHGDVVLVIPGNDKKSFSVEASACTQKVGIEGYSVNADGRIRISKEVLADVAPSTTGTYSITEGKDANNNPIINVRTF